MTLDLIHQQALDYVLNYQPFKEEFQEAIQTHHQWGYEPGTEQRLPDGRTWNKYLTIKRWFGLGARIDISRLYGVEYNAGKTITSSGSTYTYWARRQLSRVISYVGSGFLSEEQLKQRIKEKIQSPNVFN